MRCTIRWFKLGGENTKFFHAKDTERYKNNIITEIKDDEGPILTNHHDKASAYLQNSKGRIGISIPTSSPFVLSSMLSYVTGLDSLVTPFTWEEIENIVK
jgi:hypothetical protein